MDYKAVAFDMDGTLLNKNRQILPETIAAIQKLQQKGVEIILVTGRHHSMIYPYYNQLQLDSLAICCNGTYLYDFNHQKAIDGNPIPKAAALALLDKVNEFGVETLVYTDTDFWYKDWDSNLEGLSTWIKTLPPHLQPKMNRTDDFKKVIEQAHQVFKFAASSENIPALKTFSNAVDEMKIFECEWSWINRADIALNGNTKGRGLTLWAQQSGIDLTQIVAFGDNFNDLTMLKVAGLGVVMGNAEDDIKAKGDKVIGDHNSAAIAQCLTELFDL